MSDDEENEREQEQRRADRIAALADATGAGKPRQLWDSYDPQGRLRSDNEITRRVCFGIERAAEKCGLIKHHMSFGELLDLIVRKGADAGIDPHAYSVAWFLRGQLVPGGHR